MGNIAEKNEFTTFVPLIEVGDKVQGGVDGDANKQAIALANRTNNLNSRLTGLTPAQIGAEPAGTASSVLTQHVLTADPHDQYLLRSEAASTYIQLQGANLPNGALVLNAQGKIPPELLDVIQSSYVTVANQAARLALPASANLTIAVQVDIDTLFYLNGGKDPSVNANWLQGQSATVSGVSKVFGRTGNVVAQTGDYTTDQITETTNKVFATPAEKTTWNQKQDKLVDGTNIKTFMGKSLQGGGNLTFSYSDFGAAPVTHTHAIADVTNLTNELAAASSKTLVAGRGISLSVNPLNQKVTIDSIGVPSNLGTFIVVDRPGALANQSHTFNFQENNSYSYLTYALKEVAGATGQTSTLDTFPSSAANAYDHSVDLDFNNGLTTYIGETLFPVKNGTLYESSLRIIGSKFGITSNKSSTFPALTADNDPSGAIASASSVYSGGYPAFRVFNGKTGSGNYWCSVTGTGSPTVSNPQWVAIQPAAAWNSIPISYSLVSLSGDGSAPKSWLIQGLNAQGTWETLDSRTNVSLDRTGATLNTFTFNTLVPTQAYKAYRVYITASDNATSWMRLDEFTLNFNVSKDLFLQDKNGLYYTLNASNQLQQVTQAQVVANNGFLTLPTTDVSTVQSLLPMKVVSPDPTSFNLSITPVKQYYKLKTPISLVNFKTLTALKMLATIQTGGNLYLVLTRNGTDFFSWNGTAWVSVALNGTQDQNIATIVANGMTYAAVNALTAAQLASFFAGGDPDYIGYAGVLDNGTVALQTKLQQIYVTGDLRSTWKLQTPAEVEINRGIGTITFKTISAGNYKLAYQFF